MWLQPSCPPLLTAASTSPLCTFSSSHPAPQCWEEIPPWRSIQFAHSLLQSSPLTFSSATVPTRNNKIHKKLHFLAWGNNFANIYEQHWLRCGCSESKGHQLCQNLNFYHNFRQNLNFSPILSAFRMGSAVQTCDPSSLLGFFGPFNERHRACSQLSWHSMSFRQGSIYWEAQAKQSEFQPSKNILKTAFMELPRCVASAFPWQPQAGIGSAMSPNSILDISNAKSYSRSSQCRP